MYISFIQDTFLQLDHIKGTINDINVNLQVPEYTYGNLQSPQFVISCCIEVHQEKIFFVV